MSKNLYMQVDLQAKGGIRYTCWIPFHKKIRPGSAITLKDGPRGWWNVLRVHKDTMRDKSKIYSSEHREVRRLIH